MKSCLSCLVLIFVFMTYAKAQTKSDEAMVREIPHAFTAAWARHDGHELAKIMTDNVDFVTWVATGCMAGRISSWKESSLRLFSRDQVGSILGGTHRNSDSAGA